MQASRDRSKGRGAATVRASFRDGRELVADWRASGKTAAQFCRDRGVAPHRLHYWKRRVEAVGAAETPQSPEFFALDLRGTRASTGGVASEADEEAQVRVRVSGDIQVELPVGVDREQFIRTLRWVVEAMRS